MDLNPIVPYYKGYNVFFIQAHIHDICYGQQATGDIQKLEFQLPLHVMPLTDDWSQLIIKLFTAPYATFVIRLIITISRLYFGKYFHPQNQN
jgi:hypothetical protein